MDVKLPDCPHCDSAATLEAESSEGYGVKRCWCNSCGKKCRVNADGEIVHQDRVTDIRGNQMFEP